MGTTIETVRGMRDVLPVTLQQRQTLERTLQAVIASYGYAFLDLPIVEQHDLYRRKLGEELVSKLYSFEVGGRQLALRPEWTASVLRAYVSSMQDQPLPLRLAYSGPVFRYERPQRHTYRQFTQLGIELLGAPPPRADAEVIALACAGLDAADITGYQVSIGHIGVMRQILTGMGLSRRNQGMLIWNLDRMRRDGAAALRQQMQPPALPLPVDPALLRHLDDKQAAEMLLRVTAEMQIDLSYGTRAPEEIINRLVRKLRRGDQQPAMERAITLLEELVAIKGTPDEVLQRTEVLLHQYDITAPALEELRGVLDLLTAHGIRDEQIMLNLTLGRGLHYYTGLIFEIYGQNNLQLSGGGRYDDLVTALGGTRPVPAVGFTYGLERLLAVTETPTTPPNTPERVLVVAEDEADYPYAITVAARLRAAGYHVLLDTRGRSLASNTRDATRRDVTHLAIVGATERSARTVRWHTLSTQAEQQLAIDDLPRSTGATL